MLRKIFDSENSSGWLITGIVIFMVGLFISCFAPVLYAIGRFQLSTNIGFSPRTSALWYQLLAFAVLALGFYAIYRFAKKSYRVIGGLLGFVLFAVFSLFAFHSYTYVDENYIEVGKGYKITKYEWSEMTKLEYYQTSSATWYEITTEDGDEIEVVLGGLLDSNTQNHIRRTLEEYGVKMIDLSE